MPIYVYEIIFFKVKQNDKIKVAINKKTNKMLLQINK